MLPCVLRDREDYWERGAQDGHLDLHTAPEFCPKTDLFTTAHVYVPVLHPRAITSDEPTGVLVIYPFQSHGIGPKTLVTDSVRTYFTDTTCLWLSSNAAAIHGGKIPVHNLRYPSDNFYLTKKCMLSSLIPAGQRPSHDVTDRCVVTSREDVHTTTGPLALWTLGLGVISMEQKHVIMVSRFPVSLLSAVRWFRGRREFYRTGQWTSRLLGKHTLIGWPSHVDMSL